MKKIVFLQLVFVAVFASCTSDPPENQETTATTTTTTAAPIDPASIKFICQSATDTNAESDAPRHEVYLQIGNSKVKVADILNCENLGKDAYEQNRIPSNAIDAVGGWWAGAGDYLYIIEEDGKYVLKQGSIGEESDNYDFGYKAIISFDKNGNEVF